MTASAKEDKRWSDCKKMEEDDSIRTLDCLRGRLLAERQASKVANEEAQLLGDKLIAIENKLKEETKLRQKADKKLKFLMKKLESLKISPTLLDGLELQSNSSEVTSSSTASCLKDPEESASNSQLSQHVKDNNFPAALPINEDESTSTQYTLNSNLKGSVSDKSSYHFTPISYQDSEKDSQSCSSLAEGPAMVKDSRNKSDDEEENADNSMALVPVTVSTPAASKTSELTIVNNSVSEVLEALRNAREKIQSSIERRDMIRVRPT